MLLLIGIYLVNIDFPRGSFSGCSGCGLVAVVCKWGMLPGELASVLPTLDLGSYFHWRCRVSSLLHSSGIGLLYVVTIVSSRSPSYVSVSEFVNVSFITVVIYCFQENSWGLKGAPLYGYDLKENLLSGIGQCDAVLCCRSSKFSWQLLHHLPFKVIIGWLRCLSFRFLGSCRWKRTLLEGRARIMVTRKDVFWRSDANWHFPSELN